MGRRRDAGCEAAGKREDVMERAGRIAFAVAVLTLLLVVATAVLFTFDGAIGSDPVSNVLFLVAVACYAVVGGLIASRLPRNACGWLLLLIGLGLVVTTGTDVATTVALREGRTELATWTLWLNSWLLVVTVWPGIVLYLLVFPSGLLPSRRWRPFVIGCSPCRSWAPSRTWRSRGRANRSPTPSRSRASRRSPTRCSWRSPWPSPRPRSSSSSRSSCGSGAPPRPTGRLCGGWRSSGSSPPRSSWSRSRPARSVSTGSVIRSGSRSCSCLVLGLPSSAAVALLGHHLRGIEVVANRSLVYASLAATITAIYGVVVAGVGGVVGGGDRANVFAAVAATAVAAVVFQPARRRAHRFADRLIYGDRASPYQLLATFTERLDEASLPEVLPRMTALVAEGTGAERVLIWLRTGTELRAAAAWPSGTALPVAKQIADGELPSMHDPAFAVRHGGELLGAITVTMPPREPLTPATERLLDDLSSQAGLVLRNVALVEELQRSRQRLVTSQDETRRRLERDLHDGAQQRLVTLSLDLRMARARADASGDVELTTRLDAAEQELARSLAELRELARGIHPAILTQNGLGAALRSLAERSAVPVELRSAPERRLPPEIEATAYFFVSEALANVTKHAEASRAWIAAEDGGERLTIEVRDDGVGGAALNGGSGLRGLADRVEAVGGRVDVRSDPGEGTVVRAEIPCA